MKPSGKDKDYLPPGPVTWQESATDVCMLSSCCSSESWHCSCYLLSI